MEHEHRVRLPDQDAEQVRRSLAAGNFSLPVANVLSYDQLTAERDIRTYDLNAIVPGREFHSNNQTAAARVSWAFGE